MSDLRERMVEWLDILARGDIDGLAQIADPDIRLCFPFTPSAFPPVVEGLAMVQAAMAAWQSSSAFAWKDVVILRTEDPHLIVATLAADALLDSGKMYANSYVMFTRFSEDKVIEHVEYCNPSAIEAVMADRSVAH